MEHPRPPLGSKSPEELGREREERLIQDAIRERRWRKRRAYYAVLTVLTGMVGPSVSLLAAGAMSSGSALNWLGRVGWMPLLLTMCGGAAGATLVFLRSWGVVRGMITFGIVFMVLVGSARDVLGSLLPAMTGLVALFVMVGALVGYLTAMEDGD